MEERGKWGNFNDNQIVLYGNTGPELLVRVDSHIDKFILKAKKKKKKKSKSQRRKVD